MEFQKRPMKSKPGPIPSKQSSHIKIPNNGIGLLQNAPALVLIRSKADCAIIWTRTIDLASQNNRLNSNGVLRKTHVISLQFVNDPGPESWEERVVNEERAVSPQMPSSRRVMHWRRRPRMGKAVRRPLPLLQKLQSEPSRILLHSSRGSAGLPGCRNAARGCLTPGQPSARNYSDPSPTDWLLASNELKA